MDRKHIKLTVSLRQAVLLLLLLAGSLLWAFPNPDYDWEIRQINMRDFKSAVIAEYNSTTSEDVQQLSELDSSQILPCARRATESMVAAYQAVIGRVYVAYVAHLLAACFWLAATLLLLVVIRRGRLEWIRLSATASEGQTQTPAKPSPRSIPAPGTV